MPSKALKPCTYPRCPELTDTKYCNKHKTLKLETKVENNQYYDKYKRDKKSAAFYNSKAWKDLRTVALQRDNGLCQHCLRTNRFKRADVVDHIKEIKDDWSLRLVLANLESLCHACHNRKTQRYRHK